MIKQYGNHKSSADVEFIHNAAIIPALAANITLIAMRLIVVWPQTVTYRLTTSDPQ